jgi:hypothetical protein
MNTAICERVSVDELVPTGYESFMDMLMAGRPVCNARGGNDTAPPSSRDTIPCPPPDFSDDLPF